MIATTDGFQQNQLTYITWELFDEFREDLTGLLTYDRSHEYIILKSFLVIVVWGGLTTERYISQN